VPGALQSDEGAMERRRMASLVHLTAIAFAEGPKALKQLWTPCIPPLRLSRR
jgi:hypothetical protein